MNFEESYFRGEEREGFFVEEKMKRAWAAQLEVLAVVGEICDRHGITWFADSGTLLGAVRHQGFIPWDDDIDIAMKREDYERFLDVVEKELPQRWQLMNIRTSKVYYQILARVINRDEFNIDSSEEELKKYHGCPYCVGVDIFPLDYLPRDEQAASVLCNMLNIVCNADNLAVENSPEAEEQIRIVEELCNVKLDRKKSLPRQLTVLLDRMLRMYTEEESDELGLLTYYATAGKGKMRKEWYDSVVWLPFENMMLPVPQGYHDCLKSYYGEDYMTPKMEYLTHDYPFYKKQDVILKQLEEKKEKYGNLHKSKLTVIVMAHNELENLKLTVHTFLKLNGRKSSSMIIVDNGSDDGTEQWIKEQEQIQYFRTEVYEEYWSRVVNMALQEYAVDSDILYVVPGMGFLNQTLNRLQEQAYEKDNIGMAGPKFAGVEILSRQWIKGISKIQKAAEWETNAAEKSRQVLGLYPEAVFVKKDTCREIGLFDERIAGIEKMMIDYMLRAVQKGWTQVIAENALLFHFYQSNAVDSGVISIEQDSQVMEEKWGMHYFNLIGNGNLSAMIQIDKANSFRLLEIGCDCGATLCEIGGEYPNAELYGVELNESAAEIAGKYAEVVVGNIEEKNLPFEKNSFDYIIFGDVLEHLRDPEAAIMYCRELLKEDGQILASIPNLMNISVIKELLAGNFTYQDMGLLDRTHIHFFTYNEIVRMFARCQFDIENINAIVSDISEADQELIPQLIELVPGADEFMYTVFQYLVCAQKQ